MIADFTVLIMIYSFAFFHKWKNKDKDIFWIRTITYIYLSFVICFTLMPVIFSIPNIFNCRHPNINLIPFVDVLKRRGDYVRQIILNIAMTVPFGFLLPMTTKRKISSVHVLFFTLILSLSIETLQFVLSSSRTPDITDVITNFIGGAFGYGLYKIAKPFTTNFLEKAKLRNFH